MSKIEFCKLPFSHHTPNTFLCYITSDKMQGPAVVGLQNFSGTNGEVWSHLYDQIKDEFGYMLDEGKHEFIRCNIKLETIQALNIEHLKKEWQLSFEEIIKHPVGTIFIDRDQLQYVFLSYETKDKIIIAEASDCVGCKWTSKRYNQWRVKNIERRKNAK